MSGTSRTVIAQGMRGLAKAAFDDIENSGPEDEDWRNERYAESLRLQAGARTLTWVTWWEGHASYVAEANQNTRLSRMQRPLDRQPDLVDLLVAKLQEDSAREDAVAR